MESFALKTELEAQMEADLDAMSEEERERLDEQLRTIDDDPAQPRYKNGHVNGRSRVNGSTARDQRSGPATSNNGLEGETDKIPKLFRS